jgi:hypothetical protein
VEQNREPDSSSGILKMGFTGLATGKLLQKARTVYRSAMPRTALTPALSLGWLATPVEFELIELGQQIASVDGSSFLGPRCR